MEKYKFGKNVVRVCGKALKTDFGLELLNSGAFVEFCGDIGRMSIKVNGSFAEEAYPAYLGVFLDGSSLPEKIWKIEAGMQEYELGWIRKHTTVKIVKLTELQYGRAVL